MVNGRGLPLTQNGAKMIIDLKFVLVMISPARLRQAQAEPEQRIMLSMASVMQRQLDSGRELIVYGLDNDPSWFYECLVPILSGPNCTTLAFADAI